MVLMALPKTATLAEHVGLRIPEQLVQPDPRENLAHLGGARAPGLRRETRSVPGDREFPQLCDGNKRSRLDPARSAPGPHQVFRPEEKHGASGENQVHPPAGCGDLAVKKPSAGL